VKKRGERSDRGKNKVLDFNIKLIERNIKRRFNLFKYSE
jgi:hypothetical protein